LPEGLCGWRDRGNIGCVREHPRELAFGREEYDNVAVAQRVPPCNLVGSALGEIDVCQVLVNAGALVSEVPRVIEKIGVLLSSNSPPELMLSRHCPACQFQKQCRQKAVENDELSLLSGITETERQGHRSKGIFTVTQLSYTFRPRRAPKRAKNPATPHHFALQALAIREDTVYIDGTPRLPKSETQIYLDIEGLPDNESYYLIGALPYFNCALSSIVSSFAETENEHALSKGLPAHAHSEHI
jgi:predicted RecB family nuclease